MSLIEENYQDEQGNWLPEAQEILAKATTTQTTSKLTHRSRWTNSKASARSFATSCAKDNDKSNTAELSVGSNVCADEG